MTEAKALQQLQQGSREALDWFVENYCDYVGTVIYKALGGRLDQETLEELSSRVFARLFRQAAGLKPAAVRGWLGSTARRLARDSFRQQGKALPLDEELLPSPGGSYDPEKLGQQVRRAVLLMPFPDREIFLRHSYYLQSDAEIAAAMSVSEMEVVTALRRCRGRLWDALSGQEASPWT